MLSLVSSSNSLSGKTLMELQLALSLQTDRYPPVHRSLLKSQKLFSGDTFGDGIGSSRKRSSPVRSGMGNRDDDDPEEPCKRSSSSIRKDDEEENKLVGWPPVKAWRKKQLHRGQQEAGVVENDRIAQNGNKKYVKVQMEGVGIGRKIDISLHNSYQTLQAALVAMFAKYCHYDQNWKHDGESSTLTYQDKEGNWLLAGGLPWQNFVESVQRMKLVPKTT